jgi:hypothetical protein
MSLPDTHRNFPENRCPFPLVNVVPQPPPDYEPFNFPLAHTICLVTAYSESVEGLRTTLDSLAMMDNLNSLKLILVIADGMVKGAGNHLTTPEICLSMMKEFIIPPSEVEALVLLFKLPMDTNVITWSRSMQASTTTRTRRSSDLNSGVCRLSLWLNVATLAR